MLLQNKYGAQRALQRNGELVSRQLMVGVQLLDTRMRSATMGLTDGASSAAAPLTLAKPQPQPLRPHRIDASASQVCAAQTYPEYFYSHVLQQELNLAELAIDSDHAVAGTATAGRALHIGQNQGVCLWFVTVIVAQN